jgi:hypothetical protein
MQEVKDACKVFVGKCEGMRPLGRYRHKYCDMTPESRNNEIRIDIDLLGNDTVNTFPQLLIRKQQSNNFRCYATAL